MTYILQYNRSFVSMYMCIYWTVIPSDVYGIHRMGFDRLSGPCHTDSHHLNDDLVM